MRVDNSTLTGESWPVRLEGVVFAGTFVAAGAGEAAVTATGMSTRFGQLAALMHPTPGKPSPHERELGHVTRLVGALSVGVGCVTDKTGTLTENQLTVVRVWTPDLELDVERAGSSRSGVSGDRRGGCSRPR